MNKNLTVEQINMIKKISHAQGGSISAKDYNSIISQKTSSSQNKKIEKKSERENKTFSFNFDLKMEEGKITIELIGRHYSKNSLSYFRMKEELGYRKAIKIAIENFFLKNVNNKKIKPEYKFFFAELFPYSFNPVSRDDDANKFTFYLLRDALTNYGYIVDDARKNLIEHRNTEILDKEYKLKLELIEKKFKTKIFFYDNFEEYITFIHDSVDEANKIFLFTNKKKDKNFVFKNEKAIDKILKNKHAIICFKDEGFYYGIDINSFDINKINIIPIPRRYNIDALCKNKWLEIND